MNVLIFLSLSIWTLISVTDGLNCIVCSSGTNSACEDPSHIDASTLSSLSQSGYVSCLKASYQVVLSYSSQWITI
ncbi:unnamed protein product [Rotaria sordida]|uniref:Uncharacterized protein n=1 Tax=Rotaria sordida TaxID=392033 RepID=A0A814L353_9BILA|nr:unnamed protein product [Rotaria sordida]